MLFKFFGQVEESFSAVHNLTCTAQNVQDIDSNTVYNLTAWYSGSSPLASLLLPFESNANDYPGSGNNGTNNGAAYGVAGKFSTALAFDGANEAFWRRK